VLCRTKHASRHTRFDLIARKRSERRDEVALGGLARHQVAETPTYAYPVASGTRIFTKDQDNVTLWTVE